MKVKEFGEREKLQWYRGERAQYPLEPPANPETQVLKQPVKWHPRVV